MFFSFFTELRAAKIPVSLREYLTLMEAMQKRVAAFAIEDFYYVARTSLVKDERHLDRFDRVFGHCFKGIETLSDPKAEIPEEWLKKLAERLLTEEEKKLVEALGGWEKLMETLRRRLAEQKARHQGGSKWIGTAGTSPFGAHGYNPEGVRIGQQEGKHRSAVKVWDRREFRNLDDTVELGTRNIKLALRRLASVCAGGRRRRTRSRRHRALDGAQCRLARSEIGAGAAQCGQAIAVPRCRRVDGRPCPGLRGIVLGRALRIQAPDPLLFPQLPLRHRVARLCAAAMSSRCRSWN